MRHGSRRWSSETADWSTAEELEYQLEGIGRAPEETLHGLDQLSSALLDEGDEFDGLDEDDIEATISLWPDAAGRES